MCGGIAMRLLLIVLCLVIMSIFIFFEKKEKYVLAVILKGLASMMFVLLGYYCARVYGDTNFSKMVKTGLILGLIADVLLNLRFVFKQKGKLVFLVGILVFLAGHILYLCALIPTVNNVVIPLVIGIVLTAIIIKWIFTKIEAAMAFKIFGIFYIGAIVIMNCFAFTNLIQDPSNTRYIIFTIGAVSFLISDIVLILNTFGKTSKFSLRITNLSLYYIGQLLIAYSLLLPVIAIS